MTALKTNIKEFGDEYSRSILNFLILKYNYLHCFSILLDHVYTNKHYFNLETNSIFCKLLLYVLKIFSATKIYHFCKC